MRDILIIFIAIELIVVVDKLMIIIEILEKV